MARNVNKMVDRYHSLRRRRSTQVVLAVAFIPITVAGLFLISIAMKNIPVAIAERRFVHGTSESLIFLVVGLLALVSEFALVRAALKTQRRLKEVLAGG
jgi:hypothetical protein